MSLATNIQDLATRVATEFKTLKIMISGSGTGNVSELETTATNLVSAINELKSAIDDIISGGGTGDMLAAIYDPQEIEGDAFLRSNHTGTQTVSTLSDFTSAVNTLIADVIDAAPDALNTLNELAAALGDDPNFATTISNALALRLRVDAAQSFDGTQLQQGQDNLSVYSRSEIGDPTTNFVTAFETGLA